MKLIPDSGAYQAKDVIANNQRCINLYPETTPKITKPPTFATHYQRPGKVLLSSPPAAGAGRLLWTASDGEVFAVVGDTVYYIGPGFAWNVLGTIAAGINPCSMADNGKFKGNKIVLVDGTANGYQIDMTTRAMTPIVDGTGTFVGADVVKFLQGFFLFNTPNTQDWYISLAYVVAFNALDVAAKASHADNIATIGLRQREVWLIGETTTEPWSLIGGADFPFEEIPSTFVPYGCAAKYSLANVDINMCWVAKNEQGKGIIVKSDGYEVKRVSTHAIEAEIAKFATIADAVGTAYQVEGHTFYVVTFPTGNVTYVFDLATEWQPHELCWTDGDGNLNRDRALFYTSTSVTAGGYDGSMLGLDWETGDLYRIDPNSYSDFAGPISYIRGFPHVLDEMKRVTIGRLVVDIDCGNIETADDPQLNMRYSDDRGHTFSETMSTSMGKTGEYQVSPQFNQLGQARDKVIEIFWSADCKTSLNGVYLDDLEDAET